MSAHDVSGDHPLPPLPTTPAYEGPVVSARLLGLAALIVALVAILGAWGFQLIGGYIPCKLCYEERIPYYIGVPLLLIAVLLPRSGGLASRMLLFAACLVFLWGTVLGSYHAGAEWGYWPGPSDCGGGALPAASTTDLMAQIRSSHLVSCTEASLRFLNVSFAGWNAIASVIVAGLAGLAAAAWSRREDETLG